MSCDPIEKIGPSPVETSLLSLRALDPTWRVDLGMPPQALNGFEFGAPFWMRGVDLRRAHEGPFHVLLQAIGEGLGTSDRRTIAASFALRFGWSAFAAIGPYIVHRCVPDISLENISLLFTEHTSFERTAIHSPVGAVLDKNPGDSGATHPLIQTVDDPAALLALLRSALRTQAMQVVDTLHGWSGFSKKGSWGLITSSWASLFLLVYDRVGSQMEAWPVMRAFFQGEDEIAAMAPQLHPLSVGNVTQLYQRRGSCCRFYLLPAGSLCASCPLVSPEERKQRNLTWMKQQFGRQSR